MWRETNDPFEFGKTDATTAVHPCHILSLWLADPLFYVPWAHSGQTLYLIILISLLSIWNRKNGKKMFYVN